jgi:hypothetical protein
MSFGAPWFLAAGGVAALGGLALHLIVMRQPPSAVFPTTRFLPPRPALARTVARVPEDLLLLAARVTAVVCVSAAFAQPVLHPRAVPLIHLVVVDRSRDLGSVREATDSARAVLASSSGGQRVIVLFDTSLTTIDTPGPDSLGNLQRTDARGNVSLGLIGALRASAHFRDRADSMTLTLVSPLTAEEVDAATDSIRALWPGAVRLVRVRASPAESSGAPATVDWPADGHAAGTVARSAADTEGALVATGSGRLVVVSPVVRKWRFDSVGDARVVLRWVDGEPAAVERAEGTGCVRHIAVPVPTEGDLVLRAGYQRLAEAMRARCGRTWEAGTRLSAPWPADRDTARPWRIATTRLPASPASPSLAAWLLVAAAALLLGELLLRGRGIPVRGDA